MITSIPVWRISLVTDECESEKFPSVWADNESYDSLLDDFFDFFLWTRSLGFGYLRYFVSSVVELTLSVELNLYDDVIIVELSLSRTPFIFLFSLGRIGNNLL
jgi:hypothetical protein